MTKQRETFGSRMGFILAAAGAAVGLGNIWGFPTQTASNGGGAFLLVYLILILVVAYPMLVVETAIGRHGVANPIDSMASLTKNPLMQFLARGVGLLGMSVPVLVLTFYSIVGGWLISFLLAAITDICNFTSISMWLKGFSVERNIFGTVLFYVLTILIVQGGVRDGIEKWSSRLMPALFALFGLLFLYILTQNGAMEGLKHYLIPDFSKVFEPKLLLAAMGQGFFSLTVGGCSMLIYGSYLSKDENLPKVAMQVTLVDTAVAVLAGLVIIPAMYVAMHQGVEIYDPSTGVLKSADTLVFVVLPALFSTLGAIGEIVALVFFLLMLIAALTSSISMLEVPVALVGERYSFSRKKISWVLGTIICLASIAICFNFGELFGFIATLATQKIQPVAALMFCLFGGWVWNRNSKIAELKQGYPDLEQGLFWKVWPLYVKFVCPILVGAILWSAFSA